MEEYPEFSQVQVKKILPNTVKVELTTHDVVANVKAYYTLPQVEESRLSEEEAAMIALSEALDTAFDLNPETPKEEKEALEPIEQKGLLNRIGQVLFDRQEDLQLMTITIEGFTQPVEDREQVVSLEAMDFIVDSIKYLTNLMQMEIVAVTYMPVAREVHLVTEPGVTLWLTLEKEYKEQIDKFNTIYRVAELDQEDLAYIDLRIKEKVIYCPKGSRCDR